MTRSHTRPALILVLPLLLALESCGSPPKPPLVDESRKRPVNAQSAVDLLVCKNDLHNTRLLAAETSRLADTTAATLSGIAARHQALVQVAATTTLAPQAANSIYSVRFPFGSARVVLPLEAAAPLLNEARSAPLVLLRGRTDGTANTLAESRIAQARTAAMQEYLVAAGVPATRIRATHQPTGDHVAENTTPEGRDVNRRVEIEIYRVSPEVRALPVTRS